MIRKLILVAAFTMFCIEIQAKDETVDKSISFIAPVFSQLITVSTPGGFVPVFEDTKGGNYILEWVLRGESVNKWTQMITLTGHKNLALNPIVTPEKYAEFIAGGFKSICPDTFNATPITETKFSSYNGVKAQVSCGSVNRNGETYSESMFLIVIKGEADFYTVQWAERASSTNTPIPYDSVQWQSRFNKLMPIKICPKVPGEVEPYPSCIARPN
jgi:hypothetical protein